VAAALRSLDVVALALLTLSVRHGRDDTTLAEVLLLEPAEVARRRTAAMDALAAELGVDSISESTIAEGLAHGSPDRFLAPSRHPATGNGLPHGNGARSRNSAAASVAAPLRAPAPAPTRRIPATLPAPQAAPPPKAPPPRRPPRTRRPRRGPRFAFLAAVVALVAGGAYVLLETKPWESGRTKPPIAGETPRPIVNGPSSPTDTRPVPGIHPKVVDNVYAFASSTQLSPAVQGITPRVYIPEAGDGVVDIVDPKTFKVLGYFQSGIESQHITPSWDMRELYVNNELSDSLTVISPRKAKPWAVVKVRDPYNLYFTPDGSKAVVVAERYSQLDFRDLHRGWKILKSLPIPANGINHMDFTADGRYLLISAEYSGHLVLVDTQRMKVVRKMYVGGSPVDVRLAPDGRYFYVANQVRGGVTIIDVRRFKQTRFLRTGEGAHGLGVSRDAKSLYVTNRRAGTISVIDFAKQRVRKTWSVGGSPDMIQISPDGRQLWTSNRYHASVTVLNTRNGKKLATIETGSEPHGLTYFPQPGRISLGHNGVYR
jgi:YVTN family beta-propeller protein